MTRRFLAAVVGVSLAASVAACDAQAASRPRSSRKPPTAPAPAVAAAPLRIMPLGDSITDGMQVPGGYRTGLWQYLNADGVAMHFVGSEASGPAQLPERDNEGHPGFRMGQIYLRVRGWLRTARPQVVLLDIGTNDVLQNKDLAQAPARLEKLIDLITTTLPGVQVYVATIGPFGSPQNEARARRYNAAIPRLVQAMTLRGRKVRAVDVHGALSRSDLSSDGIHPTAGGFSKMAARWYSTLTSSPITRWEAEDPAYATVNNGVRLTTRAASGNGKVGYLNYADSYIEYSLTVPRTGAYRLFVHGADGMGASCRQKLTIDGRPQGELTFADTDWDDWTVAAASVSLKAGRNTVRLTRSVCSVEIDAIDLRPDTANEW